MIYHLLRAAAIGNMRRNGIPIPGIDYDPQDARYSTQQTAKRPSTEAERQRCRELGCNPHAWMRDCPLHGMEETEQQG